LYMNIGDMFQRISNGGSPGVRIFSLLGTG